MMLCSKKVLESPIVFVFFSFLFALANFVDTFLRLFFFFMLRSEYPLGVSLKPVFFGLQTFCLIAFLSQMTIPNQNSVKPKSSSIVILHFVVLALTVGLFFVYVMINPGEYGIIFVTDSLWLITYVVGLSGSCLWFFSKLLRETRFRTLSIIFLFIGLAFLINVINEIYLWTQTLFGWPLPPDIENISLYSPAILMGLASFYAWIRLSAKRKVSVFIVSFLMVTIALLLPIIWDGYRNGLINMIIRAITYWGLGYGGYGWFSASLSFAALVAYVFSARHLSKHLSQTTASYLILLGALSLPWNGLTILSFSYSSLPGNILSIDALIIGFFLRKQEA